MNGSQNHPNIEHIQQEVVAFISYRSAIRERAFKTAFKEALEDNEGGRDQTLKDFILELSGWLVGTNKMVNIGNCISKINAIY